MENVKLSVSSYKEAINREKEFFVQLKKYTPEAEIMIAKCIHRILAKYDLLYYKETIFTIIKELVNNAIKANLKRVYFRHKDLDISDPEDYAMGMESFKADTYETGEDDYFDRLLHHEYVVRIIFRPSEDSFRFFVVNNAPILDAELKKIQSRIAKAYRYADMSEAFDDVFDDSEGAGLGLIMAMMVVKNSGMPAESFNVTKKKNLTIALLKIFHDVEKRKMETEIAEEILNEIKAIPAFPENIRQIEKMCNNPEADMHQIASVISRDPGLATTILKLANSAGYYTPKKIESIGEAVKIIGIKGIKTLLIATGAQKIMDSRYKKYEELWKKSYKRAAYAQKIAMQKNMSRMGDLAYLSGLLSDIGRIILLSINPETVVKLKEITGIDGIGESTLIEEITIGVSHTRLGGMVCEKWGFDESLIAAIEMHHSPHLADEKYKPLVYSVYLADMLLDVENNRTNPGMIDDDVIDYMKLNNINDLKKLQKSLAESYNLHTEKVYA